MVIKKYIFLLTVLIILFQIVITTSLTIEPIKEVITKQEHAYFLVCSNNKVNVSVDCLEKSKLTSYEWKNNCKIYYFNPKDITCNTSIIISAKDKITTKSAQIKLIDYKYNLKQNLKQTAANDSRTDAIKAYSYSLFNKNNKIQEILDKLKNSRDNDQKCWPSGGCNIENTIEILYYLSRAGINKENKIFNDALLWLESKQIKKTNDWTAMIDSVTNTNCEVFIENTKIKEIEFNQNTSINFPIDYTSGKELKTTCDNNYCFTLYDSNNQRIIRDCLEYNETSNITIEGGCWLEKDTTECNLDYSLKGLLITDLSNEAKTIGESWLKEDLINAEITGKRLNQSKNILRNIYTYQILKNEEIKDWILFSQKNDGSFEEDPLTSLEILRIIGTQETTTNKWLTQTKEWLDQEIPTIGWSNLILNSLSYETSPTTELKIKSNPPILYLKDKDLSFNLIGNTETINSINISESLQNLLKLELDKNNKSKGKIKILTNKDMLYTGFLTIKNNYNIKRIPIIFKRGLTIDLSLEKEYFTYETQGIINTDYIKSDSQMECNFSFNDSFQNIQKTLTDNQGTLTFAYSTQIDTSKKIKLNLNCISNKTELKKEYEFEIKSYSTKPFSVSANKIEITNKPVKIKITNNVHETITIQTNWLNPTSNYYIEKEITLKPQEKAELYIYQSAPVEEEIQETNTLIISSSGHKKEIPVIITLDENIHIVNQNYKIKKQINIINLLKYGGIILSIILIILFLIFLRKRIKKILKTKKQENKENTETTNQTTNQITNQINETKENKENKPSNEQSNNLRKNLAELMVSMNRTIGESEINTIEQLKKEGYTEEEIESVLGDLKKEKKEKNPQTEETTKETTKETKENKENNKKK